MNSSQSVQPKVVAFVPNLMDRSKFTDSVTFVTTGDEARRAQPDQIFVDLDRCSDISQFRFEGPEVIGFGPHVDSELARQAKEAGYDEVVTRSVFFNRLTT